MSRYVIWIENENLEVFVGFDEGFEAFFLTIADGSENDDQPETYRFHNMAHHPTVGMSLEDVAGVLHRFGIELPADLAARLKEDSQGVGGRQAGQFAGNGVSMAVAGRQGRLRVEGWDCAD